MTRNVSRILTKSALIANMTTLLLTNITYYSPALFAIFAISLFVLFLMMIANWTRRK